MDKPLMLHVDKVKKEYARGLLNRKVTFSLTADLKFEKPEIVCLMGANGSGKTTLFEIISGSNSPTRGKITCLGQNMHNIKYRQRDRVAIHYHQSYQVRRIKRLKPNIILETAGSSYPVIHLFDEPQFNTQDGYIGFMINFFRKLREDGKLVFICLHPMENFHLQIVEEISERFLFVHKGEVSEFSSWDIFIASDDVRAYLGENLTSYEKRK